MRVTAAGDGVTVKAYGGTTGVLVAWDVDDRGDDLLGFAVERREGNGEQRWLRGALGWEDEEVVPGTVFQSNERPLQKFRWSDYGVQPGRSYTYTVHPVRGTPDDFDVEPGPTVKVKAGVLDKGRHSILFNRAAAASQAFSRTFPDIEKQIDEARREGREFKPPPEMLTWLSRGMIEQIVGFVEQATGPEWALDIAIYEYEDPDIVKAVKAAHSRGATVRVVYHAKSGDEQTEMNEAALRGLPKRAKHGRLTSRIFHHKFAVLSRVTASGGRSPRAVLCGSTNFTHNGVYRQANVVHVLRDRDAAGRYLELFDHLWASGSPKETRAWVDANNPLAFDDPLFVGFSPRSKLLDLQAMAGLIDATRRDVLFCTAFNLYADVAEALLGKPNDRILRYGVQNTRSTITGFHRDRTANFTAAAMLNKGLEGFLKESKAGQEGNMLIHTKLVVVDFTSDDPVVLSGSHNLSKPASNANDENFLVIRGDTDVADCYGVELMRIYDHYRFRFRMKQGADTPALTRNDSWADRYYRRDSLHRRDRRLFAGTD